MKHIILKCVGCLLLVSLLITSCKKAAIQDNPLPKDDEVALKAKAEKEVEEQKTAVAAEAKPYEEMVTQSGTASRSHQNIVQIASSLPFFKSLVAAVVKTGLAPTLASASLNATVFAPTDAAFAQLPAPFNNETNIAAITSTAQIDALRTILLYHVLGTEVKSYQIPSGRSSAVTLKPAGSSNDNTVYISKQFGLLTLNGPTFVLLRDVDASNGVIHVIDKVLQFPAQNIAQIAIGNPIFSSLVAALVKTNLAGVFTGNGNFTVFAPTNAAFAQLPAPFNNAANINAITNQAQINALSNILRYHVISSRYFTIDLGFFDRITTLANAPNNKVTTVLGITTGLVKGDGNGFYFSFINPGNILATNGVVQVIDRVLLPH
jgi:transforming growth factor-beta-induced protein